MTAQQFITSFSAQLISLGYNKPKLSEEVFSFNVQGQKYHGKVIITTTENGYLVEIGDSTVLFQDFDSHLMNYLLG